MVTIASKLFRFTVLVSAMPITVPLQAGFGSCDHFVRGDTNADGVVELSDAVGTLGYLFQGEPEPGCLDALDADDSGDLNITDPIYTLCFLFQGGPPPSSPGPFQCGQDPFGSFDTLTCRSFPLCDPAPVTQDHSGFARFEYSVDPALGFCPEVDKVFSAIITRGQGDEYRLEMAIIQEGQPGMDACIRDVFEITCAVRVDLPPRNLASEEIARVRDAFGTLQIIAQPDPACDCVAIDPCRIARFEWDETRASAFVCSAPRVDQGQEATLVELLESLRL